MLFLKPCNNKIQLILFLENEIKELIKGREITTSTSFLSLFFFWINIIFTLMRLPRDPQFSSLATYPVTMKYHIFFRKWNQRAHPRERNDDNVHASQPLFSPFGSILFLLTEQYLP